MSKSIYEEALEKLEYSDEIGHIPPHVYCDIQYALNKAQKQKKLIELYKQLTQKQGLYISYEEKLEDLIYDYKNDHLNENVYVDLIKKYSTDHIENDIDKLEKLIKELENEKIT